MSSQRGDRGVQRAIRTGVMLALGLVAVALGLAWWLDGASIGDRDKVPAHVVLAVACAGEDATTLTPLVVFADTEAGTITAIDSVAKVTLPGTTSDTVQESYAFGGGEALADAVARLRSQDEPLSYVVLDEGTWVEAVDKSGGVRLSLPVSIDVFDGERLWSFPRGAQKLSGQETCEVFKGAAHLADSDRETIAKAFAQTLAEILASQTDVSPEVPEMPETNLTEGALAGLRETLEAVDVVTFR